jgi:hypothetical protein
MRLLNTSRASCYIHAWCLCGRHFMLLCASLEKALGMRRRMKSEQCPGCGRNWSMFAIRNAIGREIQ